MSQWQRANRTALQFGFTLVETLVALALSSVLLVAIFGLINSTVTYQVTGTDQVLVSQRLLGLMQDLRTDVRAVQVDPNWQIVSELQPDVDKRLEAAQLQLTSQLQVTDLEKFAVPIRLAGRSDWLMLTLGYANPRWPGDADHFQQVVWSLGGRGSLNVTTHDDNGRASNQIIPDNTPAALLRTRLVANGKEKSATQSEAVVAADELSFRYLSRGRWLASWNSSTEKRLPDAVEVSVRIKNDAAGRTWVIRTTGSDAAREAH